MWYPGEEKPMKKKNGRPEGIDCPVCLGNGKRIDQKTHILRDCLICKGTGKVKNYRRYERED